MNHDPEFPLTDYTLTVNGEPVAIRQAWLGENLLYVLRERLGLTGTKNACEQGRCGSCSIFLDGDLVCACLVPAAAATTQQIVTIEGMTDQSSQVNDIQREFIACGAVQCGFCTPGMVMTLHNALNSVRDATALDSRDSVACNLCRCTGYGRILQAATNSAAYRLREENRGSGPDASHDTPES